MDSVRGYVECSIDNDNIHTEFLYSVACSISSGEKIVSDAVRHARRVRRAVKEATKLVVF